ncbi:alpha/beta hydrolase [Microlunatus flavus]|uniref:Acetyl esterase/lipase n=1 Tax=Microlunatus flavus TaxID=1036181 RepID=A0A1H9A508_9ACTN|nr:alpha/beta hydrolase [Microlunatus flavus]SEP71816.1 Acetyl esterase/lipase [Microlunatus flavus]
MSSRELIDPESLPALDAMLAAVPGGLHAIPDIVQRRATSRAVRVRPEVPADARVDKEDRTVPGPEGEPDITVRVYRPKGATGPLPGVYVIHGGGMIMGDVEGEDPTATWLCDALPAVVVSVEYRLAPEHPYPAGPEDCYAGLVWTAAHADELGLDADRLAVYGGSAGGGLAIATALLARDRGGAAIRFLMPLYPMLDDRNETPSSHAVTDVGAWDRSVNVEAWAWYLGGREADGYAAPARAEDLSGLPPTYIDVGTVDLFLDEDVDFAQRLVAAGVPTELHVLPGSYHASEKVAPDAALSRRFWALRLDALRRALA